ncbi:hypothetical protein ACXU4B_03260 [Dyella soli]|uniref:Uncharacterized protein n=1 Tax=Dyella soli TaxID=522319 RepID=A0A4R0YMG9_9GAMM|nr:hypothetical protein [Dyella soli]TCI10067.1 hypothetical protein EZM97_14140 [Dyella soli]
MVDPLDPGTMALPLGFKRGRGRPRKADALSAAERARRYRARRKLQGLGTVPAVAYEQAVRERDLARTQVAELRAALEQLQRVLGH